MQFALLHAQIRRVHQPIAQTRAAPRFLNAQTFRQRPAVLVTVFVVVFACDCKKRERNKEQAGLYRDAGGSELDDLRRAGDEPDCVHEAHEADAVALQTIRNSVRLFHQRGQSIAFRPGFSRDIAIERIEVRDGSAEITLPALVRTKAPRVNLVQRESVVRRRVSLARRHDVENGPDVRNIRHDCAGSYVRNARRAQANRIRRSAGAASNLTVPERDENLAIVSDVGCRGDVVVLAVLGLSGNRNFPATRQHLTKPCALRRREIFFVAFRRHRQNGHHRDPALLRFLGCENICTRGQRGQDEQRRCGMLRPQAIENFAEPPAQRRLRVRGCVPVADNADNQRQYIEGRFHRHQ